MLRAIKAVFGGQPPHVLYECRQCGRSLDADAEACPGCGSTEISRFEL